MSLLAVKDLTVSFPTEDGLVRAVQGVSFSVEAGQTLGIVGESGSGKSVSTQTILGLTRGARISGEALFEGRDLLTMTEPELRSVRGAEIGMIFQDPLSSLHPQYRVGWQIVEMLRAHEPITVKDAARRAVDLLGLVGIPQPDRRVDDYPHQFSGGMRQRAMIAMALALNPKLLIADEPTTALDVTVQAQIIDLIERLQREFNTAVIMITHDLGVVADIADDVMVMYAGRPVEHADRRTLYYRPHHPYTKGLIESIPSADGERGRLRPIQGQPPSLINLPGGCAFHPRCPYALESCRSDVPPLRVVAGAAEHESACVLPDTTAGLEPTTSRAVPALPTARRATGTTTARIGAATRTATTAAAKAPAKTTAKAPAKAAAKAPAKAAAKAPAKTTAKAPAKAAAKAPAKAAAKAPAKTAAKAPAKTAAKAPAKTAAKAPAKTAAKAPAKAPAKKPGTSSTRKASS